VAAKFRSKVVDSKGRGFDTYNKRLLKAIPDYAVAVGVLDPEPIPNSKLNTGQLMAIHEYGSFFRRIPARSVLRTTLRENRMEIIQMLRAGLVRRKWPSGKPMPPRRALIDVGQWLQRAIKAKFGSSKLKRAKPPDVNGPLVDSGRLRNSIKYRVIKVKKEPK
jgi:hypothetical protein